MKKFVLCLFGLCLICSLLLCSCGDAPKINAEEDASSLQQTTEKASDGTVIAGESEKISLSQLVDLSDTIVRGVYKEKTVEERLTKYIFEVKDILCGSADTTVTVCVNGGEKLASASEDSFSSYEQGKTYLLALEKLDNIFYDPSCYLPVADYTFCEEDENYILCGEKTEPAEGKTFAETLIAAWNPEEHPEEEEDTRAYATPEEELAAKAETLAVITVKEILEDDTVHNGANYACSVDKIVWGEEPNYREDGSLWLVAFKDSVEVGGTYLVGFNPVEEDSLIYTVATRNAVLTADEATITAMEELHK